MSSGVVNADPLCCVARELALLLADPLSNLDIAKQEEVPEEGGQPSSGIRGINTAA